ncbi:uncharacterized protein LOC120328336 isoform X2 [Styela clava]
MLMDLTRAIIKVVFLLHLLFRGRSGSSLHYDDELRCVFNCHRDYEGLLSTTVTGKSCRYWKASDIGYERENFNSHQMHNYCRRVNNKRLPWCYVDETNWEFCFHFSCNRKCYTVLYNPVNTRGEAKKACGKHSGELLSLYSEEEATFVASLTCLPKLVSAKYRNGIRSWSSKNATWGMKDVNDYAWCQGYDYIGRNGNCTSLEGLNCLAKVPCVNLRKKYHPACEYTPKHTEVLDSLPSITWGKAEKQCELDGQQLCSFEDLCNLPTIDKLNMSTYKSYMLPLSGSHWIPIADEYNEWLFVGNNDRRFVCAKHNMYYGPPIWGINTAICSNTNITKYSQYCSSIGKFMCCDKNKSELKTMVEPVNVFVQSRTESGVNYYHFSLEENRTIADVEKDQAEWRKYGRIPGDLRSFKLLPAYSKGFAEDPVYFCAKNMKIKNKIPSTYHLISLTPCDHPWKLNFYFYAMKHIPSRSINKFNKFLVTTQMNGDSEHSRVSFQINDTTLESDLDSFIVFTPKALEAFSFAQPPINPCTTLERIRDPVGVISSPNFPDNYPKTDPPIECHWRIVADFKCLIKIKFKKLKLNEKKSHVYYTNVNKYERFRLTNVGSIYNHNQECPKDRVEIREPNGRRNNPTWVDYGQFCGEFTPRPFITTNNTVSIRFHGSSKGRTNGFSLTFETVAPPQGLIIKNIDKKERAKLTWKYAKNICRNEAKYLCTLKDICGLGRPFYGVEKGDQWTPVIEEYNEWVQIGQEKGQTCQRHNTLNGPPEWGTLEGNCGNNACSFKKVVYCCNQRIPGPSEILTGEMLPVAEEIMINVYTTVQNGRTFYRYIRDQIDTINETSIWSFRRKHVGDVARIMFYSNYKYKFDKVVYFCSKALILAIGQLRTVYRMSAQPCHLDGWDLSFYLYASDSHHVGDDTKKIYVGISTLQPYYSRAHFSHFPPMFMGIKSFIIYAKSPDFIPEEMGENADITEEFVDKCSPDMIDILAPSILVSPGYPKQYIPLANCKWRIRLSDKDIERGVKLRMTIEELHLENDMDELRVYEAPLHSNFEDLSYSDGSSYSGNVRHVTRATNETFILHFTSDWSIEKQGFKILIEILNDKCGGNITDHGATVISENYPKKYKGGLNCEWIIKAPNSGYGIDVQFGKFELKDSENCSDDYVTVGPDYDTERFKYCGVKDHPPREQFNETTVILKFVSAKGKPSGQKGFMFNVFFWPLGNSYRTDQQSGLCGSQKIQPWNGGKEAATDRIVGGLESVPGSWPWVVFLQEATCGGTLIGKRWVITAAHCLVQRKLSDGSFKLELNISEYSVIAGRHHSTAKSHGEQVFEVKNIIIHPKYNRVRQGNAGKTVEYGVPIHDLALMKLKQTARFTDTVSPICLPTQDVVVGETCVIAGWGSKEVLATLFERDKETLYYAHVYILANSLCNSYEALKNSLSDSMMCAGYPGGGVDSCRGDSGGPLMCKVPGKGYQIKGVVSWGRGCGKSNQPGIYTRVWHYYEWINTIIHT